MNELAPARPASATARRTFSVWFTCLNRLRFPKRATRFPQPGAPSSSRSHARAFAHSLVDARRLASRRLSCSPGESHGLGSSPLGLFDSTARYCATGPVPKIDSVLVVSTISPRSTHLHDNGTLVRARNRGKSAQPVPSGATESAQQEGIKAIDPIRSIRGSTTRYSVSPERRPRSRASFRNVATCRHLAHLRGVAE